ncbi:hypothetical protein BDR22DRAFT_960479 [Usnea florida]
MHLHDERVNGFMEIRGDLGGLSHPQAPGFPVTVWFCIPTTNTDRKEYLTPFADATKAHTPPFHQYLDDDDKPYIREDLATVAEIGNGMYKQYPKVKSDRRHMRRTGTVFHGVMEHANVATDDERKARGGLEAMFRYFSVVQRSSSQIAILVGLGGSGKTQIALDSTISNLNTL